MPRSKLSAKEKNLIRRYLIWCYKTTKEELDRIDRYFTQNIADEHILASLIKGKDYAGRGANAAYRKKVEDFRQYMVAKQSRALKQKYRNAARKVLDDEYRYLANRFAAIEKTIRSFLGAKDLAAIERLYEQEMTNRILQAREHS